MVIVKSCLLKNFNLRPHPDLICAYYYMLIYNVLVLWGKIFTVDSGRFQSPWNPQSFLKVCIVVC